MIISDFATVGTKVGEVIVTTSRGGYRAEVKKSGWDIICSTTRSEVRYWKSLDVLKKHLVQAGFRGNLLIEAHTQDDLF